MYRLIRPLLFQLDPEKSHAITLKALNSIAKIGLLPTTTFQSAWKKKVMGINFPSPIGIAAGLDKNAAYLTGLEKLACGFIEVGTVTPTPQRGNPKPRLFRIPKAQALINRMGFNNHGVDALVDRIKSTAYQGILGINIGKNKDTPLEKAIDDYVYCLRKVYPYADYVTANLSSPNTADLRKLQYGDYLKRLLLGLKEEQAQLQQLFHQYVPLVVKISPDMSAEEIKQVAEQLIEFKIDGVIATNTTTSRDGVVGFVHANEAGGLSGRPLTQKSTEVVAILSKFSDNKLPIIASGGVVSVKDVKDKFDAGASLVQIYTGLIYSGPSLMTGIYKYLSENPDRLG